MNDTFLPGASRAMSLAAIYPLTETDVYEAVRDFIVAYAVPSLEADNVLQGWENEPMLTDGDYAVVRVVSATQRGTTLETFTADDPDVTVPGNLNVRGLMDLGVRVDFCGDSDIARQRAGRLGVLLKSSVGAEFFSGRELSPLYAEEVADATTETENDPALRRYAIIVHLCCWSGVDVDADYFDKARLSRLEDVDAFYRPA